MTARRRLGYLGPAIVILGAIVAGIAIWFMQTQRPVPGDVIDTIPIGGQRSLVLREEATSNRSFVELRDGKDVQWQALIPTYAGAPGRRAIAWSDKAVTVRVARHGKAEVFAFAMDNAHKLGTFKLASDREPITTHAQGPITMTDHLRAYEIVTGQDWARLIAVDLQKGGGVWQVELGAGAITDGGVEAGPGGVTTVWLQHAGNRRTFDGATGRETTSVRPLN